MPWMQTSFNINICTFLDIIALSLGILKNVGFSLHRSSTQETKNKSKIRNQDS